MCNVSTAIVHFMLVYFIRGKDGCIAHEGFVDAYVFQCAYLMYAKGLGLNITTSQPGNDIMHPGFVAFGAKDLLDASKCLKIKPGINILVCQTCTGVSISLIKQNVVLDNVKKLTDRTKDFLILLTCISSLP